MLKCEPQCRHRTKPSRCAKKFTPATIARSRPNHCKLVFAGFEYAGQWPAYSDVHRQLLAVSSCESALLSARHRTRPLGLIVQYATAVSSGRPCVLLTGWLLPARVRG